MNRYLTALVTHLAFGAVGFAGGIYMLPILTEPPSPPLNAVRAVAAKTYFSGEFRRDLKGSDLLHWGEGKVLLNQEAVSLEGRLAPGPDYRLYLSPRFVETEEDFLRHKAEMTQIGRVDTFSNFIVPVPAGVSIHGFNTVIVWCESFGQFITAARYR